MHAHLSPSMRASKLTTVQLMGLTALATLWFWPGTVIELGLHGDEAYVGLAADALARGGALGTLGMNTHTGPLHQWLVAAVFAAFGPSMAALRSVGVLCNGVAVALYAFVLSPIVGRARALWATALLVSLPSVTLFSQVAIEHFAVSPLIMMACIALVQQRPSSPWRLFGAGMLLGLGTWTHLIFLAVPAACAAVALCHFGQTFWRRNDAMLVAAGWALVYAGPFVRMSTRIKVRHGAVGVIGRLAQTPKLMWLTWHGHYAALRTVGAEAPMGANTAARAVLVGCAVLGLLYVWRRRGRQSVQLRLLGAALCAMLVTTATIAPFCTDRFVSLPLHLLPVLLVLGLFAFARLCSMHRLLPHALCACLLALQLHYLCGAIAVPWRAGAVTGNSFALFGVPETNNHYLDTRAPYRALTSLGQRDVLAQNFIGWALRFHDLGHGRLQVRLTDDDDSFEPRASLRPQDILVVYAKGYRNDHIDTQKGLQTAAELQHFSFLRSTEVVPGP